MVVQQISESKSTVPNFFPFTGSKLVKSSDPHSYHLKPSTLATMQHTVKSCCRLPRHQMTIKVVLLGDLGVGKTCLRAQFVHHTFSNAYKATIGGDYLTKSVSVDGEPVSLQIWDTAGQERFNALSQAFYRGADVCVLVYDITNYELVLSLRDWFARFRTGCQVAAPGVIIVGNKRDLENERAVDIDEICDILGEDPITSYVDWDHDVLEVSSKTDTLNELFARVAQVGSREHATRQAGIDLSRVVESNSGTRCAC